MALDAGRFLEPLRVHRPFPEVIVEPLVFVSPFVHLSRIVRRVRRILERGSRTLSLVADGAAELRQRMRTGRAEVDIEAGVRRKRMRELPVRRLLAIFRETVGEGSGNRSLDCVIDRIDHRVTGTTAVKPRYHAHAAQREFQPGQPVLSDPLGGIKTVDNRQQHQVAFGF